MTPTKNLRSAESRIMKKRRQPLFRFILSKSQITVDGAEPECFHCEKIFPPQTKCEIYGKTLTFICPNCGLSTVVNISK